MRSRATLPPGELAAGPWRLLAELRRGTMGWAGWLALALRYGGPALIMAVLLVVGFTQQSHPPVRGGSWGDVYRYQCFATAFWSGPGAWLKLPPHQCDAVFTTMAYNFATLPQSHYLPGFVQQWMILHSHVVWQFHTLPLEYPILSLVPFSLPLLVPSDHYVLAFAIEMLVVALALYGLLARVAGWRVAVLFAFLMGLGAYATGLTRFDLVPAALTFVALVLAERRRWTGAYVLLALAVCLKIYPVLLVGPLVVAQLRASGHHPRDLWRRPRALLRLGGGLGWLIGICLVAVAASVAVNPIGTYRQISVLAHRPLEVESVGASLVWLGSWVGFPMRSFIKFGSDNVSSAVSQVVVASLSALLLAGYLYVLYAVWRRRLSQAQAWLAVVLLLVVTGKILSAQYLMWVIPFAVYLMDFGGIVPLLWMLAAALTTYSFPFLWRAEGGWHAIIALRNLVLVCLTLLALQPAWARREQRLAAADGLVGDQSQRAGDTAAREAPPLDARIPSAEDGAPASPLPAGIGGEP